MPDFPDAWIAEAEAEWRRRRAAEAVLQPQGGVVIMPDLDPVPVAPPEDDVTQFDAIAPAESAQDKIRRLMQLYDGKLLT